MPELPDVEIFRRYFNATALHQPIENVDVEKADILKGVTVKGLRERLQGRRFHATRRHGKYLFAAFEEAFLMMHFGMTGFLRYFKKTAKEPPHTRFRIDFTNGYHLSYDCRRRLGRIRLVAAPEKWVKTKHLGPDALDSNLGLSGFKARLSDSGAAVKSALMDQTRIAGIGNIYADEILFQAGIDPRVKADQLAEHRLDAAYQAMQAVLSKAIQCRADPGRFPQSFIIPQRRPGGRCPHCGNDLEATKISGRKTYFCPRCQTGRT